MFLTLLAQESSGSGRVGWSPSLPFVLIAVAMYFLLIRPQRRRMQEQQALASAVEEGDEVMTTSGIYGFVTAIEGDVIWLEIAEGVDIRVARQAVAPPDSAGGDRQGRARRRSGPATRPATAPSDQGTPKGEQDAPSAD